MYILHIMLYVRMYCTQSLTYVSHRTITIILTDVSSVTIGSVKGS